MARLDAAPFGSETIAGFAARYAAGIRFVVAFSGGADSLALLHAFTAARARGHAPNLHAIHVDHHLHPDSTRWARHCMEICRRLSVELTVLDAHVEEGGAAGSDEGAARAVRYRAFERTLASGDVLCTAHSEDDHVETVLLNLLRGAGPRGLAGIPHERRLGEGIVARPVRGVARAALRTYARETGLPMIQDPANEDERFARVLLRRSVIPVLEARWPGMRGEYRAGRGAGPGVRRAARRAGGDRSRPGRRHRRRHAGRRDGRGARSLAATQRHRRLASGTRNCAPRCTPTRADCQRRDRGEGGRDAERGRWRHRDPAVPGASPPGPARATALRTGLATMANPATARIRPRRSRMRAMLRRRVGRWGEGLGGRRAVPRRGRGLDAAVGSAGTRTQEALPVARYSSVGAWSHPARVCRRHSRGHRFRVDRPEIRGRAGNAGVAGGVEASPATTS